MNQLIDSMTFEPEEGRLTLQSARYLLVRPTLLVEIQKTVETHLPHEAASILAQAACEHGTQFASRLRDIFSYSEDQVLGSLAHLLSESGWGVTTPEMVNLESRELVFRVDGSPFAEEYGPSVSPVCAYLLGIFQGAWIALFNAESDAMEVQCVAKGDSVCRFVVSGKPA